MMDFESDNTKILLGIARLETKADATNEHLRKLNGSVQTLYAKAESNKSANEATRVELLKHQIDCPGLKTINEINSKLDSAQSESKSDKKWHEEYLKPLIKWALTGLLLLALLHANDLLKAIKP
jgi:hypothetical protein